MNTRSPINSLRNTAVIYSVTLLWEIPFFLVTVALAQFIYDQTHDTLYLGYLGLTIFLSKTLIAPFTGYLCDRCNRKAIALVALAISCTAYALTAVATQSGSLLTWYGCVVLFTMGNSMVGPALQAILSNLFDTQSMQRVVSTVSTLIHTSMIVGPLIAGYMYERLGISSCCFTASGLIFAGFLTTLFMQHAPHTPMTRNDSLIGSISLGFKYLYQNKIVFGAISLDMVAVLFGGAVAMMPYFTSEVLHATPTMYGLLRAMPNIGAVIMGLLVTRIHFKQTGRTFFIAVCCFAIGILVFALSKTLWLSLFALFFLGAADMISVIIRGLMIQQMVPDQMRGRVSAFNMIFIGASNELGEFESGLTASWLGVIPATVLGSLLTLCAAAIWWIMFPAFRQLDEIPVENKF